MLAGKPLRAALAVLTLAVLLAPAAVADTLNEIILQVNDEIVTLQDFKERYLTTELELRRQIGNDPERLREELKNLPSSVLGSIFNELLILSRGDQLGERVSETEIDKEIERRRQLLQIPTEEEFRERLARAGLTMQTLRGNIRQEILIQLVMQREVFSRIDLQEDDLRRVWRDNPQDYLIPEQRKLREVVVLEDGGLSAEQMEQVGLQVQQRLTSETEPEAILGDYLERKLTSSVIDLGWVPKGDLDPALEAAVDALKPGEASGPVVGRGGLHVIHLLDRQDEAVQPFDDVKQQIYASERNRLYERELPRYLQELEEQSYIVAHPPQGAEDFREQTQRGAAEDDPLAAFRRNTPATEAPAPTPEKSDTDSDGGR
jgi:parvulin-like peptidyl-prolyl isomerase